MAKRITVDLLCEDRGHEQFLAPLVKRVLVEQGLAPDIRVVSSRGGASQVHAEISLLLKALKGGRSAPGILVVGQDGNCNGWKTTADAIQARVGPEWAHALVEACPNPHVERWFLADQNAFTRVVGGERIGVSPVKCEKDYYKQLLSRAVIDAGQFDGSGGLDFGPDLVAAMDLHATCRDNPDLGHFVDGLRARAKALPQP